MFLNFKVFLILNFQECAINKTGDTYSFYLIFFSVEEVGVEEGGEKKASKRIVATWHPYGTALDGKNRCLTNQLPLIVLYYYEDRPAYHYSDLYHILSSFFQFDRLLCVSFFLIFFLFYFLSFVLSFFLSYFLSFLLSFFLSFLISLTFYILTIFLSMFLSTFLTAIATSHSTETFLSPYLYSPSSSFYYYHY